MRRVVRRKRKRREIDVCVSGVMRITSRFCFDADRDAEEEEKARQLLDIPPTAICSIVFFVFFLIFPSFFGPFY